LWPTASRLCYPSDQRARCKELEKFSRFHQATIALQLNRFWLFISPPGILEERRLGVHLLHLKVARSAAALWPSCTAYMGSQRQFECPGPKRPHVVPAVSNPCKKYSVQKGNGYRFAQRPFGLNALDCFGADERTWEQRFITLRMGAAGRLLVVAYTWRGENIRIISAPPAENHEREEYEADR
jgi:uncharacterized DUF497 family protein